MKTKRGVILAVVLLLITAVVAIAAAQILTSSINIKMAGAPPEPTAIPPTMILLMLSDWACTGDATVNNCSSNASGGVNAAFADVAANSDLRVTRKIQNDSIKAVCISASGLVSQGVVGSLLIASIPAYDSRDVAVAFDVSALGAGDEASLPTVNLSFDFCP